VPLQVSAGNRIAALRTESMTMTAFQLEGVELSAQLMDARFMQLLRQVELSPPAAGDQTRYDPRLVLRAPEGDANAVVLRRVVAEITGGQRLAADEFTRRATAWLQGKHAYALSVRIPAGAGEDSIVRWLDSNEPGFCEYFAAALTVLARTAGHPARVVAGFHGGALNGFENYFMVRNSDAHAWVEVYDGKAAWLRADPTPGNTAANVTTTNGTRQDQDSSWSARMDSLRVLWYRRIVNFDSRAQVQMLEQVKSFTSDSGTRLQAYFEQFTRRVKAWVHRPWNAARMGRFAGGLTGLVAVIWVAGWGGRRGWERWDRWRHPQKFDPVRRSAGKWLGQLRAGEQGGERSLAGAASDPAVVADLQRLRYGRKESWPEPGAVFRRARQARKARRGGLGGR
jgi:protein-glutamine gamma-glutamyltransferase